MKRFAALGARGVISSRRLRRILAECSFISDETFCLRLWTTRRFMSETARFLARTSRLQRSGIRLIRNCGRRGYIFCEPIHIGRNCRIGVHSTVTRDISADVVAYGRPCRVRGRSRRGIRSFISARKESGWRNAETKLREEKDDGRWTAFCGSRKEFAKRLKKQKRVYRAGTSRPA